MNTNIDAERDLLSTARLCELFRCLPNRVYAAALRAGVCPALRLNGVDYWCSGVAEMMRDHLAEAGAASERTEKHPPTPSKLAT